jgi:glycosyltransferase involved in cell wall biosynthesis
VSSPLILYFQQNSAFGSAEGYIFDLALNISAKGYEVHIVCPDIAEMDGFQPLCEHGVKIHRMSPSLYNGNIIKVLPTWIKFLSTLKPSLIHFNDPCLIGSIAAAICGIPIRVMMHHTPELVRQYNLIGRLIEVIAFRTYTRVIYSNPSSRLTSIRRDNISDMRTTIIPFGVQDKWLRTINMKQREHMRAALGLKENDVMILCPARLSQQKRHDILIAAAKIIQTTSAQVRFYLAGDGELRPHIEQTIQHEHLNDAITLLGHRSDLLDIMTAADIVMLASDFEGFPYALLEGSARQVPIVATNVGGVSHSVIDGETGVLVQPGDARALAQALLTLIQDQPLRERMGQVGRARAERLFTLDRMITDTQLLYSELLRTERVQIHA